MPGGVGGTIRVEDLNRDGVAEIAYSGVVGAHGGVLWVLRWNGSTLAPLFAEFSNSPSVDLADLDGDGVAEIWLVQSGYCGGYASSPRQAFIFRWEDGAYRSASLRHLSQQPGVDPLAEDILASEAADRLRDDDKACIHHMLAMANAFRGRPDEARAAYRVYAQLRQRVTGASLLSALPGYLSAEYVEADLRAVLVAAESGQSPGWGAAERAVIHDMLGDALAARARGFQYEATSAAENGKTELEREARRKASEARQAATREYEAALRLDPTDEEARRVLGE
jgi:hypothetical protein